MFIYIINDFNFHFNYSYLSVLKHFIYINRNRQEFQAYFQKFETIL